MATLLKHGETILFIGDSITDCGWRDPGFKPLGNGFVSMFSDLLAVHEPEKDITVINRGTGGNTVEDLRSRWTDDCLNLKPDWLVIGIGINDLNQHVCRTSVVPLAPADFETIYEQILTATRQSLPACRFVLIPPFYASTDTMPHSYRARLVALLPEYQSAVTRLAGRHGAPLVDVHTVFHRHFRHQPIELFFPTEPVHPGRTGHFLIATELYRTLSTG